MPAEYDHLFEKKSHCLRNKWRSHFVLNKVTKYKSRCVRKWMKMTWHLKCSKWIIYDGHPNLAVREPKQIISFEN